MIRRAVSEDAEAIAHIHVRTWQEAYKAIVPASYLASLSIEAYVERWKRNLANPMGPMLVYLQDGKMSGWISFGRSRDEDRPDASEIYALYVSSEFWGSSVGWELIQAAEAALPKTPETLIWVLKENTRAIRFYQRAGYCFDSTEKTLHIGGVPIVDIRMSKLTTP